MSRRYDDYEDARSTTSRRAPRGETLVRERDTVRNDRQQRDLSFLKEDYGKTTSGALVIRREERDEEDTYSRAPTRRRSLETVRSRAPPERVVERDEIVIRERDRERPAQYPRSERGGWDEDIDINIRDSGRERARSRGPPRGDSEEIDINIKRREESRPPPPRSEYRERDVEEIRFRRGPGEAPARPRTEVDREEIRFTETRSPPPQQERREVRRDELDIDIDIHRDIRREPSRGQLVARDREEWIVRRPRSPSPKPVVRDYEKEEIIIRRRAPSPSPSPSPPPREATPPPPPLEPIIRPPIIQEVITHHRHIDHGIERVRSPTPPPAPEPPRPEPRVEELEIEIKRQGTRNGRAYEEDIIFERDIVEQPRQRPREPEREREREMDLSIRTRGGQQQRSPSPTPTHRTTSRRYEQDDEVAKEADYYNRRVRDRGYSGEAQNGATRDWGLVDIPPGTERVRMDGAGGGAQEISWDRYKGERRGKFITGDKVYGDDWGRESPRSPAPAPAPERERGHTRDAEAGQTRETKITRERIVEETSRGKTKDKMWTEITRDLVSREAVEEMGYEFEETAGFFYVMEYLRYEDVLHLVTLTEDIRRERRERIRELQWEREEREREELARLPKMIAAPPMPSIPPPPMSVRGGKWDEKIYERDYVYERDGRRYR
ncbi:hypothetical protein LTR27_011440 [Elasticomyces elasticus]|nr:hypothetical protein LTR27_011440 [Elasticomyces elasticus]